MKGDPMNSDACVVDYPPDLRERAEAAIRENEPNLDRMSPEEIRSLIHDLRVNRAELEIKIALLAKTCGESARQTREIRMAQDQLTAFFGASPARMTILDENLRIVRINQTSEQIFGIRQEEVAGKYFRDLFPEIGGRIEEDALRVLETGEPLPDCEVRGPFPGHPGEMITWTTSYFPLPLPDGKKGVGILAMDITPRKRVEEELARRERKYLSLFNSMDEGFCIIETVFDPDGNPVDHRFLEVNPAFEKQTGISGAQDKLASEIVPRYDKRWSGVFGRVALTGEPVRFEDRSEQLHRWFEVYAFRIDESEDRRVAVLFKDITHRKQAEEEFQNYRDHLEEQVWRRTVDLEKTIENLRREVAERERAQEIVQQDEKLLATVLDTLPVGVMVLNREGEFIRANPAGQHILGGEKHHETDGFGQLKGWRTVTGEHIPSDQWAARSLKTGAAILDDEIEIEDLEGNHKIILISSAPLRDENGTISGAVLVNEDITDRKTAERELQDYREHLEQLVRERTVQLEAEIEERKQVEKELRTSEEQLNAFFDQVPVAVCLLTDQLRYEKVNVLTAQYQGIPAEEFIGKSLAETIPEQADRAERIFRNVLETGAAQKNIEASGVLPGRPGETVYWLLSVFPIFLPGDKRKIGIVAVDITERRRWENALRKSEKRYRLLFETMLQGVVYQDSEGKIISMNPAAERILGKSQEEFLGETSVSVEQDTLHEDGAMFPGMEHPSMVSLRTGREVSNVVMQVYNPRIKGYRWINISAVPLFHNGESRPYQVYTIFDDITERRKGEERMRQLNRRLQLLAAQFGASNRELESFSYSISHDLRAPLRSIDGFSLALEEDYSDRLDEQARDYIDRIRSAAQRMARLIDDILQLSRTTRTELHYTTVDLTAQAQAVIGELRQAEPERNVEAVIQEGMTVEGDETLLRQALVNLLGNAWKFTSRQEVSRIEFGETREGGRRVFFVRDNGAGFDMRYAENLFLPFRRLHSEQEFPGTGIGLSIVRRIVQRHGGDIRAESEPGKGATFYFTLEQQEVPGQ